MCIAEAYCHLHPVTKARLAPRPVCTPDCTPVQQPPFCAPTVCKPPPPFLFPFHTHLYDLINQLGVQHARHKPGTNALDLVGAGLATGQHRGLGGLHRHQLQQTDRAATMVVSEWLQPGSWIGGLHPAAPSHACAGRHPPAVQSSSGKHQLQHLLHLPYPSPQTQAPACTHLDVGVLLLEVAAAAGDGAAGAHAADQHIHLQRGSHVCGDTHTSRVGTSSPRG